ncbi:MAG: alkylphosphonate utilization protein, partial [Panacagrimonas sp.]
MSDLPNCPACHSSFAYEDRDMLVCPECGHEWKAGAPAQEEDGFIVKDSNGNVLN